MDEILFAVEDDAGDVVFIGALLHVDKRAQPLVVKTGGGHLTPKVCRLFSIGRGIHSLLLVRLFRIVQIITDDDIAAEPEQRAADRGRNQRAAGGVIELGFGIHVWLKRDLVRPMRLIPRAEKQTPHLVGAVQRKAMVVAGAEKLDLRPAPKRNLRSRPRPSRVND